MTKRPKIVFYPARIPDNDLWRLGQWTEQHLGDEFATLAAWLREVLIADHKRRTNETDAPPEVELPSLPDNWSNHELSDALVAAVSLSVGLGTHPEDEHGFAKETGEFVDEVLIHVAAWAADRLRRIPCIVATPVPIAEPDESKS
jgi:hypothetical protein